MSTPQWKGKKAEKARDINTRLDNFVVRFEKVVDKVCKRGKSQIDDANAFIHNARGESISSAEKVTVGGGGCTALDKGQTSPHNVG